MEFTFKQIVVAAAVAVALGLVCLKLVGAP